MNTWKITLSYLLPASVLAAMLLSNFLGHLGFLSNNEVQIHVIPQPQSFAKGQNGKSQQVNIGMGRRVSEAAIKTPATASHKKAETHFKTARKYEQSGKLEKAVEAYRQALIQQPNSSQALLNLGVLYYRQHRWKQAENLFLRAKHVRPNFWKNYYNLALVKKAQKEIRDAIANLKRTLELNPNYEPAYNLFLELTKYEFVYNSEAAE